MALHVVAENAFADLLCAWRHHHSIQSRRQTTIAEQGRTRIALEAARERMHRLRAALYPTTDEGEVVIVTALCPALDEVVHLGWTHQDRIRPGNVRCPCGDLIPIPDSSWAAQR